MGSNTYLDALGNPTNPVEAAIMYGAGADITPPVAYDRDDNLRLAQAQAIRNAAEGGGGGSGGGGVLVVELDMETGALDKTAGESSRQLTRDRLFI